MVPHSPKVQDIRTLATLPILSTTEDCEATAVCARYFRLFHLGTRELFLPDPLHNVWNDCLNAVKGCSEWGVLLATTLAINSSYGPWNGERWYQELLQGWDSFKQLGGATDALFLHYAPMIEADHVKALLKMASADCDIAMDPQDFLENSASATWKRLIDSSFLRRKGDKVATCRWFQWMDSMKAASKEWHSRLLVLAHVTLQLGMTHAADGLLAAKVATKHSVTAETEHPAETGASSSKSAPPMATNAKEISSLRDKCKNTLCLMLAIHSHPSYIIGARMILAVTESVTKWYKETAHVCRGYSPALTFHVHMSSGEGFLPSLLGIFRPFSDLTTLSSCGLGTEHSKKTLQLLTLESAEVLQEDSLASRMGRLAMGVLKHRLQTLVQYTLLYPHRMWLLLHADPKVQKLALKVIGEHYKAWQRASKCTSKFWNRMKQACPLHNWTLARDLLSALETAGFSSIPPPVSDRLKQLASQYVTTKCVEDAFQRCRAKEASNTNKQKLSSATIWQTPVIAGVLSELHKYSEVKMEDVPAPLSEMRQLPDDIYKASFKQALADVPALKNLPGEDDPSWPTAAANNTGHFASACVLPAVLERMGKSMSDGDETWRVGWLECGTVVRSACLPSTADHYLVCAILGMCLAWCWPLDAVTDHNVTLFQLKPITYVSELALATVVDFAEWTVVPTAWVSPLHLRVAGLDPEAHLPLKRVGKDMPLLQHAVRRGFPAQGVQQLMRLLKDEFGETAQTSSSRTDMLFRLCVHICGCTEAEAADILQLTLSTHEDLDDEIVGEAAIEDLISQRRVPCPPLR